MAVSAGASENCQGFLDMKTYRKRMIVVLALSALVLPGAAIAQSRDAAGLADTVERLERQLQTLERTVYRNAPPPAGGGSVPPGRAFPDSDHIGFPGRADAPADRTGRAA